MSVSTEIRKQAFVLSEQEVREIKADPEEYHRIERPVQRVTKKSKSTTYSEHPNPNPLAGWTAEKVLEDYAFPYGEVGTFLEVEGLPLLEIAVIDVQMLRGSWHWVIVVLIQAL